MKRSRRSGTELSKDLGGRAVPEMETFLEGVLSDDSREISRSKEVSCPGRIPDDGQVEPLTMMCR